MVISIQKLYIYDYFAYKYDNNEMRTGVYISIKEQDVLKCIRFLEKVNI